MSDLTIDAVVHNCASRIAPVSLCSEVFDAFGHPADGAQRWQSVCSKQHYSSSRNFLAGEYAKPVRVVAFNGAEGWCRDVSQDIAWNRASSLRAFGARSTPAAEFPLANQLRPKEGGF